MAPRKHIPETCRQIPTFITIVDPSKMVRTCSKQQAGRVSNKNT